MTALNNDMTGTQRFCASLEPRIIAGITKKINQGNLMSEEVVVLKTFNNEIDAEMAQQVLHEAGVTAFVFKDDAGGMEPQLQQTNGVRLVIKSADVQRAHKMLRT